MEHTDLKHTALEVRVWRRDHPAAPMSGMPVELQRNLVKLLEGHSWDEVCETVGIGRSSLSILRKRHGDHLQLRRRVAPPKPKSPRRIRSSSTPRKSKVRLARVVTSPSTKQQAGSGAPLAHDGRLVVELGGVRVGVLDGFMPSTLGAVLDVVDAWRRKGTR